MHHLPSRYIPCDGRLTASTYFNPHSPQGERPGGAVFVCTRFQFQSTLPAGGATFRRHKVCQVFKHFNPRSPHGERPPYKSVPVIADRFQSTLPAWGATAYGGGSENYIVISIHAPRIGSDKDELTQASKSHFNPRSPHGERRNRSRIFAERVSFQSTLPAWGATSDQKQIAKSALSISIHAPRMGSDFGTNGSVMRICNFNPRSPHGERHSKRSIKDCAVYFNPRSPHGERQYSQSIQQ